MLHTFCHVMPASLVEFQEIWGVIQYFHLQGPSKQVSSYLLLFRLSDPEYGTSTVPYMLANSYHTTGTTTCHVYYCENLSSNIHHFLQYQNNYKFVYTHGHISAQPYYKMELNMGNVT
jgi:hypothetical protein